MKEKIKKIHNKYATPCKFGITSSDFDLVSQEIEHLVNQEVEKRIAERMPSEMEFTQMVAGHIPWAIKPMRRSKTQFVNPFTSGNAFEQVISILSENLYKELCSRLTPQVTPQDTPQVQKTEGGEG